MPPDGCPEGTYEGKSTCFCEDHCSWNLCRLDQPNQNCLRKLSKTLQNNVTWKWNLNEKYWVAQGIPYKIYIVDAEIVSFIYRYS